MIKMGIFSSVVLSACASIPHRDPARRSADEQRASVVTVEADCAESGDLEDSAMTPWGYGHRATGFLVSDRHVMTALHVVDCPAIPMVHVILPDGRRFRVNVSDEWRGSDSARMTIFSDETFGLGIVPPAVDIPDYGAMLCAVTLHGESCGLRSGLNVFGAPTHPGDSGSPIYDAWSGKLMGLTTAGNGIITFYGESRMDWLQGT